MQRLFGYIPFLLLLGQAFQGEATFKNVNLTNNAYNGLLIAINPEVPEDPSLVEKIKDMITEASQILFTATHKRAYFGNVTILVPKTWTNDSYTSARALGYDVADVLIANPNPMYGDNPYTLQYGQCGDPGSYIHLTPNYLNDSSVVTDYGPRGKAFVHEWAHLRWGVFDEAPTDGNDPFYWDSNQKVQATKCPLGLDGEFVFYDDQGNHRGCNNIYNGLPEDGCVFVPYDTQNINVSLMSHQFIDEVVEFCDDADPNSQSSFNSHNTEAPNEQNRLCGMRSVWSIMRSSVDFNGTNLPNDAISDVTPTFNVARARPFEKFVLVLDVSGSMGGSNLIEMQTAAKLFIEQYLPNGTKVGIVEFAYDAANSYPLVEIDEKREELANVIDSLVAGGGTCIGCGILEGLEVLVQDGEPAAGGHLIVLSDGGENEQPFVQETRDEVLAADAIVDSIFFGVTTANAELQSLVEETQGVWFFNELTDIGALIESFKQLAYVNDGDPYNQVYQIHSQSFTVFQPDHYSGTVLVDSTIGNNTVFTFAYASGGDPLVLLYSPSNEKYCPPKLPDPECVGYATADYNTITFQIPGTAAVGEWIYNVTTAYYSANVDVIVTSMAANRENPPMVVESGMSQVDASNSEPIVVYATVSIGYAPVIEADVEATITAPSGQTFILTLLDTGSAPDVRKYDGVYSRYFLEFVETGRYSVQVKVTGLGNGTSTTYHGIRSAAAYNPGYVQSDGTIVPNPNGPAATGNDNKLTTSDLDPFTRVVSPGGFSYSGVTYDPTVDEIAPGKVIDLAVEQVDNQDLSRGVRLTFSAPGSDYDLGTARAYEIRYSYNSPIELTNNFEEGILVTKHMVSEGDILSPKSAGNQETMIVELFAVPDNREAISVWFALRTYDDSDNASPLSNTAMMNVFIAPYVVPTTVAATEPATEPVTEPTTKQETSPETTTAQLITTTTTTTAITKTVGKSETQKELEIFQIITVVLAALCLILVCGLTATCVLKCRLDKQRKKFQSRIEDRLEMGATAKNGSSGNDYQGFMRPELKVGVGYPNSSYSK